MNSWNAVARALGCACLVAVSAAGAAEQTDARKLAIVYRMYTEYKQDFPGVADISPREAMALDRENRALFVDIRDPAEMEVSRLPGAVTGEAFLKDIRRYDGRTVIVYCTISYRSGKFAEELAGKGVAVRNLRGGILAWVLEGGKVYDAKGESRRIHVYGEKWNYPAEGYEAVWYGFWDRFRK
ncbi:MAG: rhodanese-like domain-containing protein [Thermodesulfobacteriota bacterium]